MRFDVAGIAAMAIGTFVGCVLVNNDGSVRNQAGFHVALGARNACMPSGQGQMGARVVIKCGGNPMLGVMTIAAMGFGVLGHELAVVGILVAGFALLRRAFET